MKFAHRIERDVCIITIDGNFILGDFSDGEVSLDDLLSDPAIRHVLINFEHVDYMDSTALGAMVSMLLTMQERRGKFALCNLNDRHVKTFESSHLGAMMSIYPNEEVALAKLDE